MAAAASACDPCPVPERPAGVPAEARWAGGCEGGAWIGCATVVKEPFTAFSCTIHDHPGGNPIAAGPFVLADPIRGRGTGGKYRPQAAAFAEPPRQYLRYDGTVIALPDGRYLVPHGTVDHPAGGGHGRRVDYHLGEARTEENY
jgi:hypothetical protein